MESVIAEQALTLYEGKNLVIILECIPSNLGHGNQFEDFSMKGLFLFTDHQERLAGVSNSFSPGATST